MNFSGKVVLVTGGTSGIGKDTAIAFAKQGANVVVAGRREAEGHAVVAEIEKTGQKGLFVKTDVSQESDVKNLIEKTVEKFGRLDIAFNNAGVESAGPVTEFQVKDYEHVFGINVLGVLLSQKYEIPVMLKQGGGVIINTTSVLGHVGMPNVSVYTGSKFAVEGITKVTALEYAAAGIRVNTVAPAVTQTEMFDRVSGGNADNIAAMTAMHPMGRVATPMDIAGAVMFLASDAASFVTGISIPVDGGILAR
ncbi:Rossmann-fold NAD(P)-binding domain-containing protein [Lacunimicrobium album]